MSIIILSMATKCAYNTSGRLVLTIKGNRNFRMRKNENGFQLTPRFYKSFFSYSNKSLKLQLVDKES